jgi:hypothetical protein
LAQKEHPETYYVLTKMMKNMKKIIGKDEENNIFKALEKSNENLGGAIAS